MELACIILVAVVIPLVFFIGMIKPDWIISKRFVVKKKRLYIFFICFGLFWVFAFCGAYFAKSDTTTKNEITQDTKIEAEQKKPSEDSSNSLKGEKKSAYIKVKSINTFIETEKGDYISANKDYTIEVLKIKDKKRNAIVLESGYGKFRYFYLKITNTTKHPKNIDRDNFYVESEDSSYYEHSTTQAIADFLISINRDAFAGEDLAPNVPVKGIVAFEVPKDGKYKLKYRL